MYWVVGNYEYLYENMGVWNLGMVLYGTCQVPYRKVSKFVQ